MRAIKSYSDRGATMTIAKRKAIVLHSGGLDSTVCLLQAIEQRREVTSLGIDYGQRHRIELEYAASQCRKLEVARKVIHVEWDKPARTRPVGRSVEEIRTLPSPAFLPFRNPVFLVLAAAEAAGLGASEIWIGVNAIDCSGYPDCKPKFVDAFQDMLRLAALDVTTIVAPLIEKTKPEIARDAYRLGLSKGETWSCYQPTVRHNGLTACGGCDACVLHEYAWQSVSA